MRMLALLGVLIAVLAVDGRTEAKAAAWCAWYDAYTYNCGFYTFESCLETVRPDGGWCARNVYPEPQRDRRGATRRYRTAPR